MSKKKSNNKFKKFLNKFNKLNFKDKRIVVLTLISILVLTLLITTSFAMFFSSSSSENKDIYESGDLVVKFDDSIGNSISIDPARPISDEYANTLEPYTFSIQNKGTLVTTYKIMLTDETISNPQSLTNEEVRSNIKLKINNEDTVLLSEIDNNVILTGGINPGETKEFDLRLWIKKDATNNMENTSYNVKIAVTGQAIREYIDPSGANSPILAAGMIPVVYNETTGNWEKADRATAWYSYNDQKWANAVTVTNTNREKYESSPAGTAIPMSDINSMWVWIPRFKYKITSNMGKSSNTTNPPIIEVVFEKGTESTGVDEATYRSSIASDGTNVNYYTHPVFRDVDNIKYGSSSGSRGAWDEELSGLWVGKFETGGTSDSPLIKPDIKILSGQTLSEQFLSSLKFAGGTMDETTGKVTFTGNNIYGLTGDADTHMIKNTEWGAVAYLSHSKYGKMGNNDYSDSNKEIYINNCSRRYTGRSGGGPTTAAVAYGTYSYDDKACSAATCTGAKTKNAGTGASTTGTIYGIYDMNGGALQYAMGNWDGYTGSSSSNSGFNGLYDNGTEKTDGISFPEAKYYDKYTGTSSTTTTKAKAILGDATWETMKWYSDTSRFIDINKPWSYRSGESARGKASGIFFASLYDGGKGTRAWHAVLVP